MTDQGHRFVNRVPDTDWAEVSSWPDGQQLAVGHLKDVSEGGLSLDLPVCLVPNTKVQVKLSTMSGGVLRHFTFTGTVVHAEASGQGCMHGIKFGSMTQAEQMALTDYLCQVENHYRVAS
jgi:hypothetical protein